MPSLSVMIKPVSSSCNLSCAYCFYSDESRHRAVCNTGRMDEKTHRNVILRAAEFAEGDLTFVFQGGEPTVAGLDFFRRHVDLCRSAGKAGLRIHNCLQTNGYAIDGEWAAFLAENGFLIGLSLDGPQEIHDAYRTDGKGRGSFVRAERAAALFDRYGARYNILCVVTEKAAADAEKLLDYFRDKGFRYLQFIPCLDGLDGVRGEYSLTPESYGRFLTVTFGRYYSAFCNNELLSIRNFDNYLMMLAGHPAESCGMNGTCAIVFTVEASGDVYPCDFYVLDEYCGGNVNKDSFRTIAASERFRRFVTRSRFAAAECAACRWFPLCRGGCFRYREAAAAGEPALNRYCESYKRFFSECGDRLIGMARELLSRGRA